MKLFALLSLLFFLSCQKGTDVKTNADLLASGAWRFQAASVDSDNNGSGDYPVPASMLEACQTDNLLIFQTSGTGTVDEGATKCDPADPQTFPFTWNFSAGETVINFSSAVFVGASGDFKVIALDDKQFVLSKQLTIPPSPFPITIIITFVH